jgi:hypothetical protein
VYGSFSKFRNKEILILGMDEVLGNSAENIKPAIESIVNTYSFDKNKIRGN